MPHAMHDSAPPATTAPQKMHRFKLNPVHIEQVCLPPL
jgi:hypothetical protein